MAGRKATLRTLETRDSLENFHVADRKRLVEGPFKAFLERGLGVKITCVDVHVPQQSEAQCGFCVAENAGKVTGTSRSGPLRSGFSALREENPRLFANRYEADKKRFCEKLSELFFS